MFDGIGSYLGFFFFIGIGYLIAYDNYKPIIKELNKELSKTKENWMFWDNLQSDKRRLLETEFINHERKALERIYKGREDEFTGNWKQSCDIFRDDCMKYPNIKNSLIEFIGDQKTTIEAFEGEKLIEKLTYIDF